MSSWLLINVLNGAQKFLSWNLWFKVAVLEKKNKKHNQPWPDSLYRPKELSTCYTMRDLSSFLES